MLSQRTRMSHAAAMRRDLAERHGASFVVDGLEYFTFPPPSVVARVRRLDGASTTKLRRLQAVAHAAADGVLDAGDLRGRDPEEASEALQQIDGVGPFGAELVIVRGAGAPDAFPRHEPRLRAAMNTLCGLDQAEPV